MSLMPRRRITFDDYKNKYDYVTLRREDGILELRIHDKDDTSKSVVWGGRASR